MKKLKIEKTKPTYIVSTFKTDKMRVGLVFSISNFFIAKTSLANNWRSFSSSNLALWHLKNEMQIARLQHYLFYHLYRFIKKGKKNKVSCKRIRFLFFIRQNASQNLDEILFFRSKCSDAYLSPCLKHQRGFVGEMRQTMGQKYFENMKVKFIYSEKATNFFEISTLLLTGTSKVEISQNFVTFSEYMNFNSFWALIVFS